MKTIITAPGLAGAIGPYSQGVRSGGFLFVSGQLPVDPSGEITARDIRGQTERSLLNLKAILEAGGASLAGVVKVTVFLADIGDFAAMNEVYKTFFVSECPARSAFQVAALPKSALVEIEAIAALPGEATT
jgi:2-iminobutanoate/2-iminopropanoate deaminase